MPFKCCIPGCRGNYKKGPKVHCFSFPKDECMSAKWVQAINRENFSPTQSSKVCDLHFTTEDIITTSSGTDSRTGVTITVGLKNPRLKNDAVPSKFPNCQSYLFRNKKYKNNTHSQEISSEKVKLNDNATEENQFPQENESENNISENPISTSSVSTIYSKETEGTLENINSKIVNVCKKVEKPGRTVDDITDADEQIVNKVEEWDLNIEASLLNEYDEDKENIDKSCEKKTDMDSAWGIVKTNDSANVGREELPVTGENSSDILDSEDLLDISMIKDSAQDDADIAEDVRQLEEENDDECSEGAEIVENSDDVSNSDNSEEDGKAESDTSDNNQIEILDLTEEKDVQESEKEDSATTEAVQSENGEDITELCISANTVKCQQPDKPAKRCLSDSDLKSATKRMKLVDTLLDDVEMEFWDIAELQSLISFSKFMARSHLKKLTRADLEEFCVQKLCEAILHKSELGETNHQLKLQEKIIETLRRDQVLLKKQIKDLEMINKKFMQEIMSSNGIDPVLPVKITRSVGLQIRLPPVNNYVASKRRSLPVLQKVVVSSLNQMDSTTPTNQLPTREISQASPQKQPKSILNQEFQNTNRTPVKIPDKNISQGASVPPRVIVTPTSAGLEAVLVNFQPTNGVINSLNSYSLSNIAEVNGNERFKMKSSIQTSLLKVNKHPAPTPGPPVAQVPNDKNLKAIPPEPILSIRKTNTGIILQWRILHDLGNYETISSYQLYAYRESSAVPSTDMWRKIGDVVAMALPMACTLAQFADKNKYYFAVRSVDIHERIGKFSQPVSSE